MHRYFILALGATLLACPGNSENSNGNSNDPADSGFTTLTDDEIVGVLHAVNQSEIAEGQVASTAAIRTNVIAFANETVSDHLSADAMLTRAAASIAIAPAPSPESTQVQDQTQEQVGTLVGAPHGTFDSVYMGFQVDGHQSTLRVIDTMLAPSATNLLIREQVQAARALAARHLAEAETIELEDGLAGGDGGPNASATR